MENYLLRVAFPGIYIRRVDGNTSSSKHMLADGKRYCCQFVMAEGFGRFFHDTVMISAKAGQQAFSTFTKEGASWRMMQVAKPPVTRVAAFDDNGNKKIEIVPSGLTMGDLFDGLYNIIFGAEPGFLTRWTAWVAWRVTAEDKMPPSTSSAICTEAIIGMKVPSDSEWAASQGA
jgi:hypothetical protein